MKVVILLSVFVLATAYTNLDDTVDFKAMLKNPTELLKFTHCLLGKGTCVESALGFKGEYHFR